MKQKPRFIVDILFILALFGVFALSALTLVTIGADVYRHTVQDMDNNYEIRTAASYITEKVRQNDIYAEQGYTTAHLTTLNDIPALTLTHTGADNHTYCTYLYFHEGYLKELYIEKGFSHGGNTLDAGTSVIALTDLQMEQISPNLLYIVMTSTGHRRHEIYVSTHSHVNQE